MAVQPKVDPPPFWGPRAQLPEVEAEEHGRVEAAEAAEEGGVGGVPEPAPRDVGGADEGSGEGEAQQDLTEEVVVAEHRWDRGRRRHCGGLRALPLGFHCGQAWANRCRDSESGGDEFLSTARKKTPCKWGEEEAIVFRILLCCVETSTCLAFHREVCFSDFKINGKYILVLPQ